MPYRPVGLFGAADPQALRAAANQKYVGQPQAPRMLAAPQNVVKMPSRFAGLGQGLAGLGKGLGALGRAQKEDKASEAIAKLYADQTVGEPATGQSQSMVTPDQLFGIASQFPNTKAGALAMQQSQRLQSNMDTMANRQFQQGQTDRTIQGQKDIAQLRLEQQQRPTEAEINFFTGINPQFGAQVAAGTIPRDVAKTMVTDPNRVAALNYAKTLNDPAAQQKALGMAITGNQFGNSVDGRAQFNLNLYDPSTPQYNQAFKELAKPRLTTGPNGQQITIRPDMSAYRLPTPGQQTQPNALGATPVPQATGQTAVQAPVPQATGQKYGPPGGVDLGAPQTFKMSEANRAKSGIATAFLADAPGFVQAIEDGALDGAVNRGLMVIGQGEPNKLLTGIKLGGQALTYLLSGAALNADEMEAQIAMYIPSPFDSQQTKIDKVNALQRNVQAAYAFLRQGILDPTVPNREIYARLVKEGIIRKSGFGENETPGDTSEMPELPPGAQRVNRRPLNSSRRGGG